MTLSGAKVVVWIIIHLIENGYFFWPTLLRQGGGGRQGGCQCIFWEKKKIQGILFNVFWNSTEKANQINWIPRSLLKDTSVHGILII